MQKVPPGAKTTGGYLLADRWRVLPSENRLMGPDLDRRIADKYMRVLVHLCEHPGVVDREELMAAVWPDTIVVDEVLTRAVSELRKLFDDDPRAPRVIETIPKHGYRLLATVAPLADDDEPHSRPPAGDRRLRVGLLGLAAAVLAAVVFWSLVQRSAEEPSLPPTLLQLTSLAGVEEYPCLTPDGDRLAYAWEGDAHTPTGVFVQTVGGGKPLALTTATGHYAYPAWSHDTRHVAYTRIKGERPGLYLVPATGGEERLLVPMRHGRPPIQPDFAPDGGSLVFAAPTGTHRGWRLERLDLATGAFTVLTDPAGENSYDRRPRFSPAGDRLAFLRVEDDDRVVAVMPTDGGRVTRLTVGERHLLDLDWAPCGDHILVTTRDGLWELDVDGGTRRLISADRGLTCVSVARNRPLVAFAQARQDWSVWESPLGGGTTARPLIASSLYDGQPAVAADGRHIAFVSQRGGESGLWVADRDGGNARAVVRSSRLQADTPAWAPDGREIAFHVIRGGNSAIAVVPVDGDQVRILTTGDAHEARPSWSADGRWLYFSRTEGGTSEIWKRPSDGGEAVRVTDGGGWRGRETPDGDRVLFTRSRRDTLGIWSVPVTGGRPELAFPLDGGEIVSWATAPDGVYLCRHEHTDDRKYRVEHRSFDGTTVHTVAMLESRRDPDLTYDAHRHAIIYSRAERLESDLVGLLNY